MTNPDNNKGRGPQGIGEVMTGLKTGPLNPKASARESLQRRLFDFPASDAEEAILFQHSVLCQTCLPFRDPGDQIRKWERANGLVSLLLAAGQAFHPDTRRFIDVGLPFGPKPRLVLYHLNAEALRTQSPTIELEDRAPNWWVPGG